MLEWIDAKINKPTHTNPVLVIAKGYKHPIVMRWDGHFQIWDDIVEHYSDMHWANCQLESDDVEKYAEINLPF